MEFQARNDRYDQMQYRRCGRSGLMLPLLSLGLWHNFGSLNDPAEQEQMLLTAFDHGITYFDLADNYGPPYGEAERTFGRILKKDLLPYRDELIISTKAGYDMWPGPYGDLGSRKHLLAGIDQSLRRMGLEYVDIFYHHRPDPDTPLEETCDAQPDCPAGQGALHRPFQLPSRRSEARVRASAAEPYALRRHAAELFHV